ncbi:unnamed protein product [Alopecurus aequalis]
MASGTQHKNAISTATEGLIQAQLEVYHHFLGYVKSAVLRAATELGIPDAIHRHGGVATLFDIATETGIHPSKYCHLRRLMHALAVTGIFSVEGSDDDAGYKLSLVSSVLVEGGESMCNLSPTVHIHVDLLKLTLLCSIKGWFTDERTSAMTLFEVAHGCTPSEMKAKKGTGGMFQAAMVADTNLVMEVVLKEHMGIFKDVGSLVDAGGGHGTAAAAIAKALPHVKCTVLDLPHVIAGAPTSRDVQFVAGDVFEYVPPADAILLKETQVLFDIVMMGVEGVERDEHQWKKIFVEAGFGDYKITPVGHRSIIEVYP